MEVKEINRQHSLREIAGSETILLSGTEELENIMQAGPLAAATAGHQINLRKSFGNSSSVAVYRI